MNIDRFSPFLQRSRLLLSLMTGVFAIALTACGGGGGGSKASSSASSSSAVTSSSYAAASVSSNGTGIWPSVKVTGTQIKTLTFEWTAVEGATYYRLMKNQGGDSVPVQVGGDIFTNSATDTISVHVHDWINTYYKVEACNDSGCEDSNHTYTATEMIKAIGYVKASNTEIGDFFGWSIALSGDGNTLAVGAPAEDSNATGVVGDQTSNTSDNSGAVYIFVKDAQGLWEQQAYLKASNTEQPNLNIARFLPNDRFGYRVALSDNGDTLAVTALLEDSPTYGINCNQDNYETTTVTPTSSVSSASSDPVNTFIRANNYDLGAVYMFKRTDLNWAQEAYVKPRFSLGHLAFEQGMRFGEALALSGDGLTLAVGVSTDSLPLSGTFTFSSASSNFGCYEFYPSSISSVSSSRSSSSITSSRSSNSSSRSASSIPGGSASGAVYIYIYGDTGWEEEGYVRAANAQAGDAFGASVDISTDGNILAVGALGEDSIATDVNGSQTDNSCYYVNDDLYVVDPACEKSRFNPRLDNGAAYIFSRTNKIWTQDTYLKPAVAYPKTGFGYSISLSGDGNTLAIGAIGDASTSTGVNANPATTKPEYVYSGAVYVFARPDSDSNWVRQTFIKPNINIANATLGNKEFGVSVSLSNDGSTLAVGSYRDESAAIGINGDEGSTAANRAGAVFVYSRQLGLWDRASYVKSSNTDTDDRFGLNVDLSNDGSTMAVGAHRESSNGMGVNSSTQSNNDAEASGAVYIY